MMRILSYIAVLFMFVLCLSSCGSSGGDKVGSLTVAASSADNGNGTYNVSALATYTNPTKTDLVGVDINFSVIDTLTGTVLNSSTKKTPTNGIIGVNYTVSQQATARGLMVVASTGDLQDSKSVTIPAFGAITANPTTLTFASTDPIGSQKQVSVTGGTLSYNTSSSNNTLATASVVGSTVTVTRASAAVGTVVITINDTAGASTTVSVALQ